MKHAFRFAQLELCARKKALLRILLGIIVLLFASIIILLPLSLSQASFIDIASFPFLGFVRFSLVEGKLLVRFLLFMLQVLSYLVISITLSDGSTSGIFEGALFRLKSRKLWYSIKTLLNFLALFALLMLQISLILLLFFAFGGDLYWEYSASSDLYAFLGLADTPIQAYQFFAFLAEFFLLLLALSQIQLIVSLRFNNAAGISTSLVLVLFHQFFYVPYSPFYYGTVLRSPVMGIGSQSILPSWYPAVSLFVCYLVLLLIGYYVVKRMDFYCVRENL